MLKLFIDRGNTALKWQLREERKVLNKGSCDKAESIECALKELLGFDIVDTVVSSVGSGVFEEELKKWCKDNGFAKPVFFESTEIACGVRNAYEAPSQLGVDRWAGMIAAHQQYSGMVCVVDTGTALTMDFVDKTGIHLGGYIVPGAELMKNTLLSSTDKINIGQSNKVKGLGCNTTEAVLYGIEQMLKSFVSQKLSEMETVHQQEITLVVTGGHAEMLAEDMTRPIVIEHDLVFDGLDLLSRESA